MQVRRQAGSVQWHHHHGLQPDAEVDLECQSKLKVNGVVCLLPDSALDCFNLLKQ